MSRSLKKGPYVEPKLIKKIEKMNVSGEKKAIKTWARHSIISPEMVGFTFLVHNGKDFISVSIVESMVGHRLGEFSPTRVFKGHSSPTQKSAALT